MSQAKASLAPFHSFLFSKCGPLTCLIAFSGDIFLEIEAQTHSVPQSGGSG